MEDFRADGQSTTRQIIQDLKSVHTRQELQALSPKLEKRFNKLVDTMIAAQEFRRLHPDADATPFSTQDQLLSDQLRHEMERIYAIEGGQEIVEKSQEGALDRLNTYEKRLSKRNK